MKLLLIQPPVRDFYDTGVRLQPLGLCMLKAAVKRHVPGVDVVVRDYHQGRGRRSIPYPKGFAYLKDYYRFHDKGPFSTFHHYYHFGAGFDEIAGDVAGEAPDMVGISSLFSPYYSESIACARAIKAIIDVPVIMGGSHVSAAPMDVLTDPAVDYIIRGEGERPLVEFLRTFMSGGYMRSVPNLGFKEGREMILNPMEDNYDIKDLPWADLSDLSPNRYTLDNRPLCFITTSRGCPHRCAFCSVHLTFGNGFRARPLEDVVSEIQKRYDDGYRVFDFEDDNLSFRKEYFHGLMNRLASLFPDGDLRITAMNGISYISLDAESLTLMKKAGFRGLNLSLVSSNEETMERYRRPHDLKRFLEIVEKAHELGLDTVTYQILGLPDETLDDMTGTMALLAGLPVLIGVSIFYLTPGSPIAQAVPQPMGGDVSMSRSTAMAVETDKFNRDDLYTLFITARIINFLKGMDAGNQAHGVMNLIEMAGGADRRAALGADILKRLIREKRLYAETGGGMRVVDRFKPALFFRVWENIPYICTRSGGRITPAFPS